MQHVNQQVKILGDHCVADTHIGGGTNEGVKKARFHGLLVTLGQLLQGAITASI